LAQVQSRETRNIPIILFVKPPQTVQLERNNYLMALFASELPNGIQATDMLVYIK
jgi:hypothetical protein